MKKDMLETLIKDKDLSQPEVLAEITTKINDNINSLITKKETEFKSQLDNINAEFETTKSKLNEYSTKYENLEKNSKQLQSEKELLEKRNVVLKTVGKNIDQETIDDLVSFTTLKAKEGESFEDTLKVTLNKFNLGGEEKKSQINTNNKQFISVQANGTSNVADSENKQQWVDHFFKVNNIKK